jgi:branched-chain amino acid transport system ATP-binding protein
MSQPILAIRGLRVKMGAQEILHGVDLDCGAGEIVAVLGANGAGKTTLMRAISGIYRADAGEIRFLDDDIANMRSHLIVQRGLLQAPEGRQIFSNMSVRENLVLGGGSGGTGQMERVLAMFPQLHDRLRQTAGSLSGGEQQMLCIGRALMRSPKMLLLDEPSLGLAPKMVKLIFDLVREVRSQGVSILIVEQNARAALAVADRAAVMEGGRIALAGSAADLAGDQKVVELYLGGHA